MVAFFALNAPGSSGFFQNFQSRKLLLPVGQLAAVTNRDDGATVQADLDVGLQLFFGFLSSSHEGWVYRESVRTSKEHKHLRKSCLV